MGNNKFLSGRKKGSPVLQETAPPRQPEGDLTQTVVFGKGDSSVAFVDESRGLRKLLVDAEGVIRNFPGICREDFWVRQVSPKALEPRVRYRTDFEQRGNKWIMRWTVQPDGDYWRDSSGFGAEDDEEVVLYTYVDGNGDFTGPFRLYELGDRCYSLDRFELAHGKYYEDALEALKLGSLEDHIDVLFPRLQGMGLRKGFWSVWEYYTLCNPELAAQYWSHPVLSAHLLETAGVLLQLGAPATELFGYPGNRIVQGCMTLFYTVTGEPVFQQVLDKFFGGEPDAFTKKRLS